MTDTKGILKLQETYYKELYRENKVVDFKLENIYGVEVPKNFQDSLSDSISIEE